MGCLGRTQVISSAFAAFERMRQKVLDTEAYAAAVKELSEFITGEEIERRFSELEKADVEKELAQLKAKISGCSAEKVGLSAVPTEQAGNAQAGEEEGGEGEKVS